MKMLSVTLSPVGFGGQGLRKNEVLHEFRDNVDRVCQKPHHLVVTSGDRCLAIADLWAVVNFGMSKNSTYLKSGEFLGSFMYEPPYCK